LVQVVLKYIRFYLGGQPIMDGLFAGYVAANSRSGYLAGRHGKKSQVLLAWQFHLHPLDGSGIQLLQLGDIPGRKKRQMAEPGEGESRAGADNELTEGEELIAVFPALDLQEGIQSDHKSKAGIGGKFLSELGKGIKGIGNSRKMNFPFINGKLRERADGQLDHGEPVKGRCQ